MNNEGALFPFNRFRVDFDFDLVANHHAARFRGLVVADAVIFAIHFGFGMQADTRAAPGIGDGAAQLDWQRNFFGHAAHREIADDHRFVALLFNTFADEGYRRIFLGIEEIRSAKMGVALGNAGIDAFDLDGALRFLDGIVVHDHRAGELIEFAMHVVNHEVADGETD